MSNKNTIAIELIVNDNGSVTIKQFGAEAEKALGNVEKAGSGSAGALDGLQKSFTELAVKATAAWLAINKAMSYVEMGAKAEQAEESFRRVAEAAGESSDKIIDGMKRAAAGTVDDSDIMQKAVKGMALGFNGDQMVKIMESARISARITGEDVQAAYEKITDAISTNMPRALKQYGLITKEEMSLVNKALAAGAEDVNLYGLAMAHATLQAAKLGEVHANAAEGVQVFKANIKEVGDTIGKFLIGAFNLLSSATMGIASSMQYAYGGILKVKQVVAEFFGSTERARKAKEDADFAFKFAGELGAKALDLSATVTGANGKAADSYKKVSQAAIDAAQKAVDGEKAKLKAYADAAEQAKELQKRFEDLSKVIAKVGEDQLKMAGDTFNEKLKAENATVGELKTGLEAYLVTLQTVFDARIAGEKAVEEAMAKAGSKPEDRMKANVETLKLEKAYLAERLGGWQLYYNALAEQHKKATDLMETKTAELKEAEEKLGQYRQTAIQTMINLETKLMEAQGRAANSEEISIARNKAAEGVWALAMQQSGEERIKLIQQYISMVGQLTGEVVAYGKGAWLAGNTLERGNLTVLTSQDAIKLAMERTTFAQAAIYAEAQKMIEAKQKELDAAKKADEAAKEAMIEAKQNIVDYQQKITDLAAAIDKIERNIAIGVTDNATGPIARIRAQLENLVNRQWVANVTINERTVSSGQAAAGQTAGDPVYPDYPNTIGAYPPADPESGGGGNYGLPGRGGYMPLGNGGYNEPDWRGDPGYTPSYASGTKYVPRTGLAILHQGEEVRTAAEVQKGSAQTINFSPVITIQGTNKSPEQLAREMVRPLQEEIRRLNARAA